eukprot:TRINITY_DN1638_c0_g2_i1.p1 TRINITY_DN1638_c0_g2~~TRINITY_DN1638_c0_g2_i1.p1  ORF type:complete len:384 (+),score=55.49 TRINITY_DN1638_c0_g2_i1:84-1235(+)
MGKNKQLMKLQRMVGMPLMGVCWPEGDYIYVGGGGGKSASGIQNRVVMVEFKNGEVSDVLNSFSTGDNAVLGLAINPAGKPLIYFFEPGQLERIDIKYASGEQPTMQNPKTETSPEFEQFRKSKEITAFTFSSDGHLFAAGCEDGSAKIFEGMYFNLKITLDSFESKIYGLDLNSSGFPLLLVLLKDLPSSQQCVVTNFKTNDKAVINLPRDFEDAEFRQVKFVKDGSCNIVAALNFKDAGYLAFWSCKSETEKTWQFERKQKVTNNNMSAFDVGPEGNIIGLSDTEGNIVVVSYPKFKVLKKIQNAHMVFPTQLAFAAEGHAFASVAADASVTVIPVQNLLTQSRQKGSNLCTMITILLLIVFVVLVYIARQQGYIEVKMEF